MFNDVGMFNAMSSLVLNMTWAPRLLPHLRLPITCFPERFPVRLI